MCNGRVTRLAAPAPSASAFPREIRPRVVRLICRPSLRGKISVAVAQRWPSIATFRFGRPLEKFVPQFVDLSCGGKIHAGAADFEATVRYLNEVLLVFHGRLPSVPTEGYSKGNGALSIPDTKNMVVS